MHLFLEILMALSLVALLGLSGYVFLRVRSHLSATRSAQPASPPPPEPRRE